MHKKLAVLAFAVLLCGCLSGPKVEISESQLPLTSPLKLKVGEVYEYEERVNVTGNLTKIRVNFTVLEEIEIGGRKCLDVSGKVTDGQTSIRSCFDKEDGTVQRIRLVGNGSEKEIPKELLLQFTMFFFDHWMLSLKEKSHYQINTTKSYTSSFGIFDSMAVNKRVVSIDSVRKEKFFERDAFRVEIIEEDINTVGKEQTMVYGGNYTLLVDEENRVLLYSRDGNGVVEIELVNASFKIR
jgi:hypothetical protein